MGVRGRPTRGRGVSGDSVEAPETDVEVQVRLLTLRCQCERRRWGRDGPGTSSRVSGGVGEGVCLERTGTADSRGDRGLAGTRDPVFWRSVPPTVQNKLSVSRVFPTVNSVCLSDGVALGTGSIRLLGTPKETGG